MKIIHFITTLGSGGAEKMVVDLANQQTLMGHDVTVCILLDDAIPNKSFNQQFLNERVRFHSLKAKSGLSILHIFKCFRYFFKEKPNVIHCHLNVLIYVYLLAFFCRSIKVFNTLHSVAHRTVYHNFRYQYNINRYFFKKHLIIPITISKQCHESYIDFYKLNNDYCIINGRSLVKKTNSFNDVRQKINALKQSPESFVFCHVGRCDNVKNQLMLLKAFKKLRVDGLDCILIILGAGFDSDLGESIKSEACEGVYFLGEKANVSDYLCCSNAFCLSSLYALLESMSVGLTSVCTPVGGNVDVVKDGVTGYLSKDTNDESYSVAMKLAIIKPIDPNIVIKYYKENYSMEKCAEEYIKCYTR